MTKTVEFNPASVPTATEVFFALPQMGGGLIESDAQTGL